MCHDAASATPSALTYRLSLWQAILRARGFRGGFASWWQSRPVQLVGSPPSLPSGVPDAALACALHEDFRCNYRRFEAWHLKRRAQVIDATYDKSLAQLFQELREPAHEQVDSLTIRRDYAILVVAPEGDQVHLDRPPDLRSFPVAVAFKGRMADSAVSTADSSEWDLLDARDASILDWEVLSSIRWAPTDDDTRSVAESLASSASLCTAIGWPSLSHAARAARSGELLDSPPAPAGISYKDALMNRAGGLNTIKASEMARGPVPQPNRCCFVNGYRRVPQAATMSDPSEDLVADQDWYLRKEQGSLLARRRWRFDRRPFLKDQERRSGRSAPSWEYEFGSSSAGYCIPEEECEDDEPV
eukprot:s4467_g2.t1